MRFENAYFFTFFKSQFLKKIVLNLIFSTIWSKNHAFILRKS